MDVNASIRVRVSLNPPRWLKAADTGCLPSAATPVEVTALTRVSLPPQGGQVFPLGPAGPAAASSAQYCLQ